MPKQKIQTANAPKPGGPYSQAIVVDGWVFVAGQVPVDPASGDWVTGDIQAQAERVLNNVQAIVTAAGGTLDDVVKTTVFLNDMGDFAALNEIYARYFDSDMPPARSVIEAAELPRGCKLKVEAVAKIGSAG